MKVYAQRDLAYLTLNLLITDGRSVGKPYGPLTMITAEEEGLLREPTLQLPIDAGQPLLDALWDAGYRPSTVREGTETTQAMRKHIEFAENTTRWLFALVKKQQGQENDDT